VRGLFLIAALVGALFPGLTSFPGLAAADELPEWVEPMRKVHAEFDGNQKYVAQFGDSITRSLAFWSPLEWDDPQPYLPRDDGLPILPKRKRWREVIEGARDKGPTFGNEGGWRVDDVLKAMGRVLEKQRPAAAIVMVGTNDIRGNRVPEKYAERLEEIIDRCLAAHCIPLLSTIPPMTGHDKAVAEANEIIRSLAEAKKIPLVDYHAAILERRPAQTWQRTLISDDGVHPTADKTNDYSRDNLLIDGYALRNWVTFLKFREVYFYVLAPEEAE
jgi:hypothetical protein